MSTYIIVWYGNVSYTMNTTFRNYSVQSGWNMMIKARLQNSIITRAAADVDKVVKQNIAEERSQL